MATSSPEYSITKPGLHHLRKRAKPLRTYGRQPSAPEAQTEPPLKRLRLSALKQQQEEEKPRSAPESSNDAPEREATPPAPSCETETSNGASTDQVKPEAKCAPSSKGSILSYFKPAPAPPKPRDETQPPPPRPLQDSNPQPEDEQSIPPNSPPKRKQPLRRKPRLLKIKPTTHDPLDEPSQEQAESPHIPDETTTTPQPSTTLNALTKASRPNAPSTSTSTSSSPPPSSPPRKTSLRNHQKPRPSRQQPPPSSTVQTTLNISAKAAFSECKICDTVWNPLYPDDVKFHNKTHKAVLRAQRKRMMDEL